MIVLSPILSNLSAWQICTALFATVFAVLYYGGLYGYVSNKIDLIRAHKKVVGAKAHWFWGHLLILNPNESGIKAHIKRMEEFPKVQQLQFGPMMTRISCYFPSIVSTLLQFDNPKGYWSTKYISHWIGDGLLLTHGKKWKSHRKLLTHAFHFDILKSYVQVFNESVKVMESKLKETNGPIDVFKPVSLMALDSMLQCIMSYKSDCQKLGETHPYVIAVNTLADGMLKRTFSHPFLCNDFIYSLTRNGRKFFAAVKVSNELTSRVIQNRIKTLEVERDSESTEKRRHDFLDILLLSKDVNGNRLSEKDIQDEVDTFMFEGHDTTASGMSWILYDLATNPEHQEKCREEVNDILGEREYVEWEDLSKFNYLTMCIKESMRIHPPVPFIGRHLVNPIKFGTDFGKDQLNSKTNGNIDGSQEFPVNTNFEITIMNLHHNPHIWKDPETFDPLRFTPENFSKLPHFAYIPFSAGIRNCIGQNFAMMETKIAIAKCLKNFDFYVDSSCPKPSMTRRLVLRSETGINIIFKSLAKNGIV